MVKGPVTIGLLWMSCLLSACGQPSDRSSPSRTPDALLARVDHAARCLQITAAIAALPAGPMRDKANDLELARITPELASRWVPVWKRAARDAKLPPEEAAISLSARAAVIDTELALDAFADEAFECGADLDATSHD